jgi:hypothetical protein
MHHSPTSYYFSEVIISFKFYMIWRLAEYSAVNCMRLCLTEQNALYKRPGVTDTNCETEVHSLFLTPSNTSHLVCKYVTVSDIYKGSRSSSPFEKRS